MHNSSPFSSFETGGSVVKNPPSNSGDVGLIPGPGEDVIISLLFFNLGLRSHSVQRHAF